MSAGHTPWDGKACPECGEGRIRVRLNLKSGEQFYGCSNYRKCGASWDLDELNEWEVPKGAPERPVS